MYEPLRRWALAFLRVPPEPHPPFGDPASLRVFRAGRNYFRLHLAGWAAAQLLALAGILFWTATLISIETVARADRSAQAVSPPATAVPDQAGVLASPSRANQHNSVERFAERVRAAAAGKNPALLWWVGFRQTLVEVGLLLPAWAFPLIWALKIFSFVIYLIQIPITYAVRRLDYEMRWYMVTDRSLRLRHGVWKVAEATMSFANLQQVEMTQGPVQRLLGLADVRVQSAGGGGGGEDKHQHDREDMHVGLFHCVTNGPEIRDLILERLRRYRESGLGDPEEVSRPAGVASQNQTSPGDTLAAARELLTEARALRVALS